MRTVILIFGIMVCIIATHAVVGQPPQEGSIIYEVKVNLHRTIPQDRQEMKNMIPEFNTFEERLLFRKGESLYKPVEDESEDEFAAEGGAMRMRFRRPSAEYYFDQDHSRKVRSQEFFGKRYLIEDSVAILPWKFGSGTKTILGYVCKEASWFNDERKQNVLVWYTDQLKPFLGPENYNSLPGTVLQVDINDGERVLTARKVELQPLKKNEFKVPASGQKITDKDFREMMQDQMRRMNGGQGNVIIRTN